MIDRLFKFKLEENVRTDKKKMERDTAILPVLCHIFLIDYSKTWYLFLNERFLHLNK